MADNFLDVGGLYETHMDRLESFNSKSVTHTYIGYSEHNLRGEPNVRQAMYILKKGPRTS